MIREHKERERFAEVHVPCPCGKSSDAACVRHDGSTFCFSCNKNFPVEREVKIEDSDVRYEFYGHRGISKSTMQRYGVLTKFDKDRPDSVAFPHGGDARFIRKIERIDGKISGFYDGVFKDALLFGQDIFDPGSKESITIFEGQYDALAGYEMLLGRSACVSVTNGANSTLANLRKFYEYVNSFDKIYLCLDNDTQGQEAVKSVQGLFDFKKVYHVKFHKFKDANEYLLNNETEEFRRTWESAKRFVPDNIISTFFDVEKALEDTTDDQLGSYPFEGLNDKLFGLFAEEVVCVKAPEGVGKTEFFRALEFHMLKTTKHPIGIIHLEENNATTIKALAGYQLEIPAVLPNCGLSRKDILSAYRAAVRDDEGRVHIHSSYDVDSEEAFLGNIRFLVSALGCRFIFLDHISWLATGLEDEDERRKLDRISQRLKLLAKELRFCLVEISHVNDNGQTRGSRNISKVANTVISLSRDLLDGATETFFLVEKARLGGMTGPAGSAHFHRDKGMLLQEAPKVYLPEEV